MKKTQKSSLGKRLGVIVLSLLLIFISTSLFSCINPKPMPPKEELYQTLENVDGEAAYLNRWGFRGYYSYKLSWVESCFNSYFYEELPSTYETALTVAYDFLDNYYDTVNLENTSEVTTAIIDCYVAAFNDDYAVYRSPEEYVEYNDDMSGEFCGIGVSIEYNYVNETMLITAVMKDSPAEAAGFLSGDYIIGVDGVSIDTLGLEGTANAIKGEEGTNVSVTVLRNGEQITLTATRAKITEQSVYYEMLDDGIAYIQITQFKLNTDEQFGEALAAIEDAGALGVIFDLRSNPGGYLESVTNMIEYLVPANVTIASYTGRAYPTEYKKSVRDDALDIPCVVLCNEYSASAAELFTSAVRDYGEMGLLDEVIVGTKTFGKGIMQGTVEDRLDHSSITMTIAYYNPPLGKNFHGEGIIPDRQIENSGNTDEQFNTALLEILAKTAT